MRICSGKCLAPHTHPPTHTHTHTHIYIYTYIYNKLFTSLFNFFSYITHDETITWTLLCGCCVVKRNVMLVKSNVVTVQLTSYSSCNRLQYGIYLTECRLHLLQWNLNTTEVVATFNYEIAIGSWMFWFQMLNIYQRLPDKWVSSFTQGNLRAGTVFVKCLTLVYYKCIYFIMK